MATRPDNTAQVLEAYLRDAVATRPPLLSTAGWKFHFFEELVLRAGRPYYSAELTDAERAAVMQTISMAQTLDPFEFKHCYYNAQRLMSLGREAGLVYVEGYVLGTGLPPFLHGWVTINGKVIDPTVVVRIDQQEPFVVMGTFSNRAYWGVALDRKYVMDRSGGDGPFVGILDTDWQRGFPLLRKGVT